MKHLIATSLSLALLSGAAFAQEQTTKDAVFAAGCFWCIEKDYEKHDGVIEAVSGYAGGKSENATYNQVSAGGTEHKEVVKVTYDPSRISYGELLEIFWQNVDPFNGKGQFCDKGSQYSAAIFYGDDAEKALAEQSKDIVEEEILNKPVVTQIQPLEAFYPAEDYHQNYYKTNSVKYKFYRWNCGRDQRLEEIWEKANLSPFSALTKDNAVTDTP